VSAKAVVCKPAACSDGRLCTRRRVVPIHFPGEGDKDNAIAALADYNVEITDLRRYTAWLKERWQVRHRTRMNASRTDVKLSDFDSADIDYMREVTRQDLALYDFISGRLDSADTTSLRGPQVVSGN
jgi:hypothetical protein